MKTVKRRGRSIIAIFLAAGLVISNFGLSLIGMGGCAYATEESSVESTQTEDVQAGPSAAAGEGEQQEGDGNLQNPDPGLGSGASDSDEGQKEISDGSTAGDGQGNPGDKTPEQPAEGTEELPSAGGGGPEAVTEPAIAATESAVTGPAIEELLEEPVVEAGAYLLYNGEYQHYADIANASSAASKGFSDDNVVYVAGETEFGAVKGRSAGGPSVPITVQSMPSAGDFASQPSITLKNKTTLTQDTTIGSGVTVQGDSATSNPYVFANGYAFKFYGNTANENITVYGGLQKGDLNGDTSIEIHSGTFKSVFGGSTGGRISGNTSILIGENAKITDSVFGGSPAGTCTIQGDTSVQIYGTAAFVYGGGTGSSVVEGNTNVTVYPGARIEGGAVQKGEGVYGGGLSNSVVRGDATITIQNTGTPYAVGGGTTGGKVEGKVTVMVTEGAEVGTIIGGGYNNSASPKGEIRIEVTGAKVDKIYGGSSSIVGSVPGGDADISIDINGAEIGEVYADGYKDVAPVAGRVSINVTGQSTIGAIYGNADEAENRNSENGSKGVSVNFENGSCSIVRIAYDIDHMNISNAVVQMVQDERVGEYEQLYEVKDLNMNGQAALHLTRNGVLHGNYTAAGSDKAILGIMAGKKLLIKGSAEGETLVQIAESDSNKAALSQVYVVAQGDISEAVFGWTDSLSPARFQFTSSGTIFGAPENVNLSADELQKNTGSGAAAQKWWLSTVSTQPDNPGGETPENRPDGGRDRPTRPITPPDVILPEEELPAGQAPIEESQESPEVEIPEEAVPAGQLPQTGGIPAGPVTAVGALLLMMGICAKRKKA